MKKNSTLKLLIGLSVAAMCFMSGNLYGDDLPPGVVQVWTSIEGNITYYVKEGDKVKAGDPLFFVISTDNNPAMFFKVQSQLELQRKLFIRRENLIRTHAVSQEDYDEALQQLVTAEADMISYLTNVNQGFYVAPFDCEIVKLLYLQHSGIGDGNPAINIKSTDKNYKFEPPKPNKELLKMLELSKSWVKNRVKDYNFQEFKNVINREVK